MSIEKTLQIRCESLEDTLKLGESVGRACKGGEVFELISDLGGGKTAFVRGMALGVETEDEVTSPSFTINNTYKGSRFTLEHFDFYRLGEAGVVADELREDIYTPNTIVAVEWGEIVHNILPTSRIKVEIAPTETEARYYAFVYGPDHEYLFSGVEK
jgi:tRNA threonylcarbamoyladenosine biosynthesis protein TsaE